MKFYQLVLYFIITVLFLSSIGVWLPYGIDYFFGDSIKQETSDAFAGNLMTYYLAIFTVGIIDRLLSIIDNPNYNFKKTEFLLLVTVSIVCLFLTIMAFKNIFHKKFDVATNYAFYGTILSVFIWWLSKWDSITDSPANILGGPIR